MIYISSSNDMHPVTKTFTPLQPTTLQYTCRQFTSSHLNFTPNTYIWKKAIGDETWALPCCYAACNGTSIPMFTYTRSLPFQIFFFFAISWFLKIGPICCPEMSARIYQYTLHNNLEESRFYLHRGASLKSRKIGDGFLYYIWLCSCSISPIIK